MPKPPSPDEFSKINFVVNYALLGCTPPFSLFVEFAREPAADLAHLLLVPDFKDIAEAIFEPKKQRQRRAGRRGRKRRRRFSFPDTSDMIGQRVRATLNPFDVFKLSPVRYLFILNNIVDAVNITVALVDGFSSIFYEGLLGVITVDKLNCRELSRLVRENTAPQSTGGAGPAIWPVFLPNVIARQDFLSDDTFCRLPDKDYVVVYTASVQAINPSPGRGASVALGTSGNTKVAQSSFVPTESGEVVDLDVSHTFSAGQTCAWGLGSRVGGHRVLASRVVAYSVADLPFPWS